MKKNKVFLLIFIIFVSGLSFSQTIKVSDSLTVEELVKDILVQSSCANIENMVSSTGVDFGSDNGIAFFKEGTGNFPYKSGILLSTGNAKLAEGPKTADQSNGAVKDIWGGDRDLEKALSWKDSVSVNASYIEFDFTTPLNQISFDFIFASEEYGKWQCEYTDGFAFLLTDLEDPNEPVKNLALVPNTADPISVFTIRDKKFLPDDNSIKCESVNPEYFDRCFDDTLPNAEPQANSPTNFRGYTKSIKAYSKVKPNRKYRIKLVIADYEDNSFDAGIFLEAGSFNLGGALGDDITIQGGKAACVGGETTIKSGLDADVPHVWYLNDNVINGATTSELTVSEPGVYKVQVVLTKDCIAEDTILVEFIEPSAVGNVKELMLCDDGTGLALFDLTLNSKVALDNQDPTLYQVKYYETEDAANAGVKDTEIKDPRKFQAANNTTIFVRVEDIPTQKCFAVKPFKLKVDNPLAEFSLTPTCFGAEASITGTQGGVFSFNPQPNDGAQIDPSTGEIVNGVPSTTYTVQYNITGFCEASSTEDVTLLKLHDLVTPEPLVFCADDSIGVKIFDLTSKTDEVLGGLNLGDYTVTFYSRNNDALERKNEIVTPDNYSSKNATVWVRVDSNAYECFNIVELELKVYPIPVFNNDVSPYIGCDDDGDSRFAFDLSTKTEEILSGTSNKNDFVVTYHKTQAEADNGDAPLQTIYTNDPAVNPLPQTIYVRIENAVSKCSASGLSFILDINDKPKINSDGEPLNLEICDDTVELDADPSNDTAEFDLNILNDEILDGLNPDEYTITYHTKIEDAEAGTNAIANSSKFKNTVNPQEVFVRVVTTKDDNAECYALETITLSVNPLPILRLDGSYIICVNDGDDVYADTEIDTGLNEDDYTFEWFLEGSTQAIANTSSYKPTTKGTYTVTATNAKTGCTSTSKTLVSLSGVPIVTAKVTTATFAEKNNILVTVTSDGDSGRFQLSLNNGPWKGNIYNYGTYKFKDVPLGEHTITVRDSNGCGEAIVKIDVMGSPPFFTPNSDGYHDTWNIYGMHKHPEAKIYVYDRFGKLITQVNPLDSGWDGNYKGRPMPSSDYWFTVEYIDDKTKALKKFSGHFSLKR